MRILPMSMIRNLRRGLVAMHWRHTLSRICIVAGLILLMPLVSKDWAINPTLAEGDRFLEPLLRIPLECAGTTSPCCARFRILPNRVTQRWGQPFCAVFCRNDRTILEFPSRQLDVQVFVN